jgi:ATP synthase protein I
MILAFSQNLFKLFGLQFLLIFILGLLATWGYSVNIGLSFLLGGLINIIPSYIFAKIVFKQTGARALKKTLNAFYVGEALKLLLTAFLFFLVFQWQDLQALSMFLGFVMAQMIYWAFLYKMKF